MGWLLHCDNGSLRKHKPSVPCSALLSNNYVFFLLFFYLGFLSRTFTVHETAGEGGGYLFNSSLPLPPASQTLRYQPGDYCRELTSAHSWQPDSNREPLVSERKSLNNYVIVKGTLRAAPIQRKAKTQSASSCQAFLSRPSFVPWQRKVSKMHLHCNRPLFYPSSINFCYLEFNYITTAYQSLYQFAQLKSMNTLHYLMS